MIESRCGLCCTKFNCKEEFGFDCKGCSNESKIPWGECEIKICCEKKGYAHCGECDVFPCDALKQFSFDKTHGDNGARLEQCKQWAK